MNTRPPSPFAPRRGFALLITITLLAFLVLLLVSLSSLTRVETQVAANSQQLNQARQNALMALNVALGQLQQAAGPDQRITARAEILDNTPATPAADGVKQPFWTAVWTTGSAPLDTGAQQRKISLGSLTPTPTQKINSATAWLVSRDPAGPAVSPDLPSDLTVAADTLTNVTTQTQSQSGVSSAATGATPTGVVLAKNIGLLNPTAAPSSSNAPYVVAAPLVDIKAANSTLPGLGASGTSTIGRYAYWVSDEGVKAKVNLTPDTSSTTISTPARNQRHYLSPATLAAEQGLASSYRSAMLGVPDGDFGKLLAPSMLPLSLGSAYATASDGYKASLPDLTTYSSGVLADVRNGGLKKDLTAAFENQSQFTTLVSRYTMAGDDAMGMKLWRSSTTPPLASGYYLDGPRWASFFYFYNLYKASMPPLRPVGNASAVAPKGVGTPSTAPTLEARTYRLTSGSNQMLLDAITPRFLAMKMEIGISSENTGGGQYRLRLHYFPALVLYNPYNVTLTASPGRALQYVLESNAFGQDGCVITKTNAPAADLFDANLIPSSMSLATDGNDATFAPGEVRIFGLSGSAEVPTPWVAGLAPNAANPLKAGYLDGTNLNYVMPLKSGAPTTLAASDTIQIRIAPRIRANRFHLYAIGLNLWPDSVASTTTQPLHNGTIDYSGIMDTTSNSTKSNIFTTPPTVASLDPSLGGGGIQRIGALIIRVKGSLPVANPLAPARAPAGALLNTLDMSKSNAIFDISNRTGTGFTSTEELQNNGVTNSFWGKSDAGRSSSDPTQVILREIPNQPMISLGQFMHMTLGYNVGSFNGQDFGGLPVGNSFADVMIKATDTSSSPTIGTSGIKNYFNDDNFLNNEALFDTFYFSTIPPDLAATPLPSGTTTPDGWSGFNQASVNSGSPLLNPRHKFARTSSGAQPALADLRDMDKAAAGLMVEGAFNVNSTSVPAWRALFGSLRFASQTNAKPLPRFTSSLTSIPSADNYPQGMRVLTDTQLDALATAMVEQVKTRGPFLSMADFVNRRLTNGTLGQRGALQAAIDASGINTTAQNALGTGSNMAFANPANYPTIENANLPANTAIGAPGFILQSDILQALAPVLTARSDTFVVRTYGETRNPVTDEVTGTAWVEAVVQRIPEYIDPTTAAHIAPTAGSNNETFGRRFKIVSFRWLSSNDL